jgi:phenylalanyl-tRNA synthetase beta chain
MIVTRSWLNEWIDLGSDTTEALCKTFNAIGLEVDSVTEYRVPKKVIVGEVIECKKHPDADKLNVCKVDIGGSVRQIVCGASNVREGIKVSVATIGAKMPGGLVIKPVQLRGVDSEGMICSSTEIGLPKINEGIMILDESFGQLKLGDELCKNPYLNDDAIEIELTANRGDCLSIQGVARDLAAALNRNVHDSVIDHEKEGRIGIGRIAQMVHSDNLSCDLSYRAVDIESIALPGLVSLRLAMIEESFEGALDALLFYATYTTGVILRVYDRSCFRLSEDSKAVVEVKKDDVGFATVLCKEGVASVIGVIQEETSRISDIKASVFIEASYIAPDLVSKMVAENKRKSGPLFYRTSRGSEPYLDLGLSYLFELLQNCSDVSVYGGSMDLRQQYEARHVKVSAEMINAFIGTEIDKTTITNLLKKLGFAMENNKGGHFAVRVPRYRHDIVNQQDVVEEIVRLVGIDNIPAKPSVLKEASRLESDYQRYQKRRQYRYKAAYGGFFESVHFIFSERAKLESLCFTCTLKEKELLNPITATLDTLRPTLLLGLLEAASLNAKSGQRRIALFELGSVFDSDRNESVRMAFVYSGEDENAALVNAGRPAMMSFEKFCEKIATVIGDFELETLLPDNSMLHPYQSAQIVQNGVTIGRLFKLHPTLQEAYDLAPTYMCELDFERFDNLLKIAKPYSRYQASYRDLSIVVPDSLTYKDIASVIQKYQAPEVIRFYPVDRYKDASLGDNNSLSIRFVLQSLEKTLEEEDITSAMESIVAGLQSDLGVVLR